MGAVVGGIYYNTSSGLDAPGGLLDQIVNPDYALKRQLVNRGNVFRDGLPTDAGGNLDFAAAAKKLFQVGAFEPAAGMLQAGLAQQGLAQANRNASQIGQYAGGADANAQPSAAPAGYSPEVVDYITSASKARGINPNLPLRIFAAESKMNPAAAGDPNGAGQNTSFGIPQLHYGSSGGGPNSVAGMGDDFTKATGLDARDPRNWKATIDFALDQAARNGWGPWHAAQKLGIPNMAGIGGATGASQGAPPAEAGQVASTATAPTSTDETPVGSRHPFAPNPPTDVPPAASPPSGQRVAAAGSPIMLPGAAQNGSPPAQGGSISIASRGSLAPPTRPTTPPASSPNSGMASDPADVTFNGQVPLAFIRAGHSPSDWVSYARQQAALNGAIPGGYGKANADQWSKIADGLEKSIQQRAELTPEQKIARDPVALQAQIEKETARGRGRADAEADYALVPVAQPDGSVTLMPKKAAIAQASQGGTVVHSLPAFVTSGQSALRQKLADGTAAYQERQIAGERLDAISNLLSNYQTGANSTAFNNAAAKLRSFGIEVPNSAMVNPAAMQQLAKNTYANVLSNMREQGNKQFVSEVQSAISSNPSTELQPEANAAMVAQMRGIQKYHDANFRDYAKWYDGNRGASNDAQFQIDWAHNNPVEPYISAARKDIAPLGVALPPKGQLVDGQAYMVQSRNGPIKARWSAEARHFVPAGN